MQNFYINNPMLPNKGMGHFQNHQFMRPSGDRQGDGGGPSSPFYPPYLNVNSHLGGRGNFGNHRGKGGLQAPGSPMRRDQNQSRKFSVSVRNVPDEVNKINLLFSYF